MRYREMRRRELPDPDMKTTERHGGDVEGYEGALRYDVGGHGGAVPPHRRGR